MERRSHKNDIKYRHNYSDILVEAFTTEIQSRNCGGNDYLSIEGVALEYYKIYNDRKLLTKNKVEESIGEFHCYLSDDSKRYASTTAAQITYVIDILVTNN